MPGSYGVLVAFSAAVGGLLFGYEIGVVSQVLEMNSFQSFMGGVVKIDGEFVKQDKKKFNDGMTTFMFLMGCSIGAIVVSYLADAIGRKKCIRGAALVFLIGSALQSAASSTTLFFVGRWVAGTAIGVLSMCVPLFISETSPTAIRGRMITIQQLMITIGILIASIINTIIIKLLRKDDNNQVEWRLALGMQMVPAFVLVLLNFVMPESPRWLVSRSQEDVAVGILAKLQGAPESDATVQAELKSIVDSIEYERSIGNGSWSEVFGPGIVGRTLRGFFLQFWQQWTGINVILYYQGSLLQGMGLDKDKASTTFTLINNTINVIGTFPGMYFIERFGRRSLLLLGGIGMGLSHYLVCLFINLGDANKDSEGKSPIYFLATASVWLFIIFFSSTWGPVAWVYQSEIFPLRVRSKATGVATFGNWSNNAIISFITPTYFTDLKAQMYLIFGTTGLCMAAFTYFFIPETMGVSLEDMDELFGVAKSSNSSKAELGKM